MNKIFDAIKCSNCHKVMESPVILPCQHSMCKIHTLEAQGPVICYTCGNDYPLPSSNRGFPVSEALNIIAQVADIGTLDFGPVHKEAKNACVRFEKILDTIENVLSDPSNFTHEAISSLAYVVQLKGEEMKLKIDENMERIFRKLNDFSEKCKMIVINERDFTANSENIRIEKATGRVELKKWFASLNEIKLDEKEWKRIKSESEKLIRVMEIKLTKFKAEFLLQNRFGDYQAEIEQIFGEFSLDPAFNFDYHSAFDSNICHEFSLKEQLFKVCGFDSSEKLDLIYRGSLDGFGAAKFHAKCDNIPKTLTIIKSTIGHIFGGYTEATWTLGKRGYYYKSDPNAFLFSLVNSEKRPVKVKIANGKEGTAILCDSTSGPIFGCGLDIYIADNSNCCNESSSNFSGAYKLKNYTFGSEKAKTFLAGSEKFKVEEIEVFSFSYF